MREAGPWYMAVWRMVDGSLRRWANTLRRLVRLLRLARALLVVGILSILASALVGLLVAAGVLDITWFFVAYAISTLFVIVPLVAFAVLVSLPLRAKSVIRLVDMGYPANARELAIRVLARKLRDESIETEELLVETALNEARKAMRRMDASRQARGPGADDATDPDLPPPSPPSPPWPPSPPSPPYPPTDPRSPGRTPPSGPSSAPAAGPPIPRQPPDDDSRGPPGPAPTLPSPRPPPEP